MAKDTGIVNIHGKEYETVASRVARFREAHKDQFCIATEIISADEKTVVMKASISHTDGRLIATGHAEEVRTSSQINRTSALENAETSAIGRALAAFGMAGTEFSSADEVAQAITQQASAPRSTSVAGQGSDVPATDKQKELIKDKLAQIGISTEEMKGHLMEQYGVEMPLTKEAASFVLDELLNTK